MYINKATFYNSNLIYILSICRANSLKSVARVSAKRNLHLLEVQGNYMGQGTQSKFRRNL